MTAQSTRVIFNADDFGLCPQVNEAVVRAYRGGLLRSASILATGAAFAQAGEICRELPGLSVGLHVALVHQVAACRHSQAPTVSDRDGNLPLRFADFVRPWMLGRIARTDVAREINRQAEIVHEAGLRPTHLDGHQHLHLLPGVLEVCLQVCRSYHIPFIRIPGAGMLTTSQPIQWGRRLQFCLLRILAMRQRAKLAKVPVRCCDGVWGLLEAGRLSAQAVASLLDGIGAGLHEFVTHPATEPPRDCLRYPWGYQWTEELAALQSDELRQALQRNCIELTDFRTEARRQGAVAEGSG